MVLFSKTKRNSALKTLLEKDREEAAEDLEVDETARELIADQTHRLRNTHALRRVTYRQRCRKICGLGCVNRAYARTRVTQPSPHIFLSFLYMFADGALVVIGLIGRPACFFLVVNNVAELTAHSFRENEPFLFFSSLVCLASTRCTNP